MNIAGEDRYRGGGRGDARGDAEESEGKGIPTAELAHYHVHKVY